MSKAALVVWLTLPLMIVGVLALMMDRERGRPSGAPSTNVEVETQRVEEPDMVEPESLEQGFILVVEDKSKTASAASPIHMPSSHNGWNPGDKAMMLSPRSDMKWQILWEKPKLDSRIAFKFARGSWERVEVDATGKNVENRLLPKVDRSKLKPGEKPIIELAIESWADLREGDPAEAAKDRYRPIAVSSGRLARVEVAGGGASDGRGAGSLLRDLLVWLPPGYDDPANAGARYPVLYLHDGQNVFDKLPGLPGEWRADETAAALIKDGAIEPLIVVGIPHAGERRMAEYLPVSGFNGVEPQADRYIDFLIDEVRPRIERAFRVKPGAENSAIGGASLGAVVALEAATQHPEIFGKVLLESMPTVSNERLLFRHFANKTQWPGKVYFGMGGMELGSDPKNAGMNQQYAASAEAFKGVLTGRGFDASRMMVVVEPNGIHDETAWARRFGPALTFLFGKPK